MRFETGGERREQARARERGHRVVRVAGVDRARAARAARRASGRGSCRTARSTATIARATLCSCISTPQVGQRVDPFAVLVERHRERLDVLVRRLAAGDLRAERRLRRDHRRPQRAEHARARPGSAHGGSASTTSWPRSRSSAAASPTAPERARIARSALVDRRERRQRDPQPARRGAGVAVNGVADGVAQATSPSAWPARTSSATAVSCVVRETTPSTPRNEYAASGAAEIRPRWVFRPDEPAARGGDARRAAAVVGVGDRHHAGGDRGRRAAGRAAGRARRIPRVARRAEPARLGRRRRSRTPAGSSCRR